MLELGRTEEVIREMNKTDEDHTHIAIEEDLNVYRRNWWVRSNFVGSDTMPDKASPWLQRSVVNLASPQKWQRIKLITKIDGKALPRLGGDGKIPGGIPHLRHHRDDGLDTDGAGEPAKISEWSIHLWNESHNEFGAKVTTAKFGNSQRSLLSPTVLCKGVYLLLQKTGYENCTNTAWTTTQSTEDKHETNHINNEYNDTNTDTRKLHNLWACTESAQSSLYTSWCCVTCTSWLKVS